MMSIHWKWSNYLKIHINYKGPTGSRTQVAGFKVQSANHYTIEPVCSLYLASLIYFNVILVLYFPPLNFKKQS